MAVSQPLQSRLIGALFVERGLVSESQIRVALELQHETGQQLGQILVERFGVSRKELASVVAEQWAKLGGSAGPEDNASWRRLGEIFAAKANAAVRTTEFLIPRRGVSLLDGDGQPFCDRRADEAMFNALRERLDPAIPIAEIDANINDPIFAERAVDAMLHLIAAINTSPATSSGTRT